jgi:uncharacterized Zn finger protein (UPF0148 family)
MGKRVRCPSCGKVFRLSGLDETVLEANADPQSLEARAAAWMKASEAEKRGGDNWASRALGELAVASPPTPCGECGKPVPAGELICPHCGHSEGVQALNAALSAPPRQARTVDGPSPIEHAAPFFKVLGLLILGTFRGAFIAVAAMGRTLVILGVLLAALAGGFVAYRGYSANRDKMIATTAGKEETRRMAHGALHLLFTELNSRGALLGGLNFRVKVKEVVVDSIVLVDGMLPEETTFTARCRGGEAVKGTHRTREKTGVYSGRWEQEGRTVEVEGDYDGTGELAKLSVTVGEKVLVIFTGYDGPGTVKVTVNGQPLDSGQPKPKPKPEEEPPVVPLIPE